MGFSESFFMVWLHPGALVYWVSLNQRTSLVDGCGQCLVRCHKHWYLDRPNPHKKNRSLYHGEMILSIILLGIYKVESTPLHFHWFSTKVFTKWSVQGPILIWVIFFRNFWLWIIYQPHLIWFISMKAAFTIAFRPEIIHQQKCTVVEIQFTFQTPVFFFDIKWNMKRAQSKAQEVIVFVPIPRKSHCYFGSVFLVAYPPWNSITSRNKHLDFKINFQLLHRK